MTNKLMCYHKYEKIGQEICPNCSQPTHEINWNKEYEYYQQWKKENFSSSLNEWWSI